MPMAPTPGPRNRDGVIAMFAHELGVPFELDVVHDLLSLDPATYGAHPALKIPTLHVGETALFGTENICRKLAEIAGRDRDPVSFSRST